MSLTHFRDIPTDVLLLIINYLEQAALLEIGLTCSTISFISIKQLWHSPRLNSLSSLESLMETLRRDPVTATFPYHTWIYSLDISFETTQLLANRITLPLNPLTSFRSLQLYNAESTNSTVARDFLTLFIQQPKCKSIVLSRCSVELVTSLPTSGIEKLHEIGINECYLTDSLVNRIATAAPELRCFVSQGSGYMSDAGILAIVENCPFIESLVLTLPRYIVQSNTVTNVSLQALSKCSHLKVFICKGQVRIASDECKYWLFQHCPSLIHCDVSFSS